MKLGKLLIIFLFLALFFLSGEKTIAVQEQTVDYTLPYPGILPDNPMYQLKVTRDRIVSFLIADTSKKAAFNLLQADKRLQAGLYLLQKSKSNTKLALITVDKGENYFTEAISQTEVAIQEKKHMGQFVEKLLIASQKHGEILKEYEKYIQSDENNDLLRIQKRVKSFEEKLVVLRKKNLK